MRQAKGREPVSWATDWMTTYVLEIMNRYTINNLFFTRKELYCKLKVISKHSVGNGEEAELKPTPMFVNLGATVRQRRLQLQ